MKRVVCDTGPILHLREADLLDLLSKIGEVSREVEEKALDIFEGYDDKDFSFTDCVSFVVMWEMGMNQAFTFDQHFDQVGFIRKP